MAEGATNQLGFDSTAFAAAKRLAAYRDLYSGGADVDRLGGRFGARMTGWRLDRSLLYDRRLSGVGHVRDDRRVRRDAMAHVTLTLVVAGEFHADAGDGYRRVMPGELLLLDMTRPMRNRVPAAHIVTMSMTRDRIARLVRDPRRLHGRVIPAAQAVLLADHMRSLARNGAEVSPAMLMPLARVGLDLLGGALATDPIRERPTHMMAERIDRARAYIEERLFEPALGPEAVMARFALSRATLYRDFQQWGGLASYIRSRRLEVLGERLADRGERRSLADLADLLGFSTEARLSEAFLARFGMRPGAYRTMTRHEAPVAEVMRHMREWQSVLR
jgi:AraC-like DNA-binding protein